MTRFACIPIVVSLLTAGCGAEATGAQELDGVDEAEALLSPVEESLYTQGDDEHEDASVLSAGLWFVVDAGEPALVLSSHPDESSLDGPIEVWAEADDERVQGPVSFRAFSGRARATGVHATAFAHVGTDVNMFDENGFACRARVIEIGVLHRGDSTSAFEPAEESAEREHDASERAWELGETGALLVGRSSALEGDCSGARYATPADEREPVVFAPAAAVPRALEQAALTRFRDLDAHAEIQTEYDRFEQFDGTRPPKGSWDGYDAGAPSVTRFRHDESGRTLLLVSASAGAGCGDFYARLWALFEVGKRGLIERVVQTSDHAPDHVLERSGDRRLTLFSGDLALIPAGGGYREKSIVVPYHGCTC